MSCGEFAKDRENAQHPKAVLVPLVTAHMQKERLAGVNGEFTKSSYGFVFSHGGIRVVKQILHTRDALLTDAGEPQQITARSIGNGRDVLRSSQPLEDYSLEFSAGPTGRILLNFSQRASDSQQIVTSHDMRDRL